MATPLEYLLTVVLPTFFYGLTFGAVYGLIALGLTIICGVTGVIHFAHGHVAMLAAYIGFTVLSVFVPNFAIAILIVIGIITVFGCFIEKGLCRPLYGRPPLLIFVVTWGLALFLRDFVLFTWGSYPIVIREPVTGSLFGIPMFRLVILAVCLAVFIGLWLFFNKTKYGSIIRATTEDSSMAACLGINVPRVKLAVFALSSAVAGLAAMLALPLAALTPEVGSMIILWCFYIVIIGGMGSIGGSILAAFLLGQVIALGSIWFEPREMEILSFALILAVLAIRPRGFFGRPLLLE
jgi:branched-chain amino acid transport system permease protein